MFGTNHLDEKIKNTLSKSHHVFNSIFSRSMPDLSQPTPMPNITQKVNSSNMPRRSSMTSGRSQVSDVSEIEMGVSTNNTSFLPPINPMKNNLSGLDMSSKTADFFVSPRNTHFNGSMNVKNPVEPARAKPGDTYPTGYGRPSQKRQKDFSPDSIKEKASSDPGVEANIRAKSGNILATLNKQMDEVSLQLGPRKSNKFSAYEEYKRQILQQRNDQRRNDRNPSSYVSMPKAANKTFSKDTNDNSYSMGPDGYSREDTFRFQPLPQAIQHAYQDGEEEEEEEFGCEAPNSKPPFSSVQPSYDVCDEPEHSSYNLNYYAPQNDYWYNDAQPAMKNKPKQKKKGYVSQRRHVGKQENSYAELASKQNDYRKRMSEKKIRKIKPVPISYLPESMNAPMVNNTHTEYSKEESPPDLSLYKDAPRARRYFESLKAKEEEKMREENTEVSPNSYSSGYDSDNCANNSEGHPTQPIQQKQSFYNKELNDTIMLLRQRHEKEREAINAMREEIEQRMANIAL